MFTRRDVVIGGAVGAFSSATGGVVEAQDRDGQEALQILNGIKPSIERIAAVIGSNSLALGYVPKLREAYTKYFKSNSKWPTYCEVGMGVFYDIYDWHIKNGLTPQVGQFLESRLAIDFMYTHLLVRYDLDPSYIGLPFERV